MARERARAKWDEAAGARAEVALELRRLRSQRQAMLRELEKLQGSVAASKTILREQESLCSVYPPGTRPKDDPSRPPIGTSSANRSARRGAASREDPR